MMLFRQLVLMVTLIRLGYNTVSCVQLLINVETEYMKLSVDSNGLCKYIRKDADDEENCSKESYNILTCLNSRLFAAYQKKEKSGYSKDYLLNSEAISALFVIADYRLEIRHNNKLQDYCSRKIKNTNGELISRNIKIIYLDAPQPTEDGSDLDTKMRIPNPLSLNPLDKLLKEEQCIQLREVISNLNDKQKRVVCLRYLEDMSRDEIAKEMRISTREVNRLHKRAINKLKELLTEKK